MITDRQEKFIQDDWAWLNILGGAVRSGKTYILYEVTNYLAAKMPPGKGAIIAKTLETLRENILEPMIELMGPVVSYSDNGRKIKIGSRKIRGVGANDEKSQGKIRGDTLLWAVGDEVTLWPESFFNMLISRLSLPNSILFASTNPDSPFHWLKTNFIDKSKEIGGPVNLKYYHFDIDDNTYLDSQYVDNLKSAYFGFLYNRFIDGQWVSAEGQIYDMFDDHLIDDLNPDDYQFRMVGVDYGTTNPFVLLDIGFNSVDDIGILREYYFDSKTKGYQKTDNQYCQDFLKFIEPIKNFIGVYVDPSAASFIRELAVNGGTNTQKVNNEVIEGINFVAKKFNLGHLKVDKNCLNLIKEFRTYQWDAGAQKRGDDKPLKTNDHGPDAARYGIFSRFGGKQYKTRHQQKVTAYSR